MIGVSVTMAAVIVLSAVPADHDVDRPHNAGADRTAVTDFELLSQTQRAFQAVAEALRPGLVIIETVGGSQPHTVQPGPLDKERSPLLPPAPAFREQLGSNFVVSDGPTTGIVYSADGYIITSSFNFVRAPVLISVVLPDGRRLAAELVARDQVRKVALLKVDASNLTVPRWCDLPDVRVGQWAVALGLGFGGDKPSITTGIVSAINRMHGNAVQTDAILSPSNYGGPVCDLGGRIIGMAVPMAQRPGELAGIELYDSGVGFAVPKHRIDEIVAVLKTGKSIHRGWLGIEINRAARDRVVIQKVAVPSPMHQAGVEPGDVIVKIEDQPVKHFGHLVQALYMIPAGERVRLRMKRDDESFDIDVTLARSTELGALPDTTEPFDPSEPAPTPDEDK